MTTTESPPGRGVIGQRLLRREDPALLTGEARFTNDLVIPGALHLAVAAQPVRPRPHRVDRHVRRRGACPASSPSTPAPTCRRRGPRRCRARGRSPPT